MMEKQARWTELDGNQRRIFVDTAQLHQAYVEAFAKSRSYRGGMYWKKATGREYLFRSVDRRGYGRSLGARSAQTEETHREFHENKKQCVETLHHLRARLKEQARFCKAARIARVPKVVGSILRLLEQHKLLGNNLQVIGTNALYAYEAAAGIVLESGLMATQDVDILWDVRSKLKLNVPAQMEPGGFLAILQAADRSFELIRKRSFRAVNRDGYMVDLVKAEPRPAHAPERRAMGNEGKDLVAAEIRNLQWLLSSPKFTHHVICEDGFPALMSAPDPRAFALHKLWLSHQPDREPLKRKRDKEQSLAVCMIVLHHMPHLGFTPAELRMFPKSVVAAAARALKDNGLPPGYTA
jgi:hypothetical protein